MSFNKSIIKYFKTLESPDNILKDVSVLDPYSDSDMFSNVEAFYNKFYNDSNKRIFIYGINPGRLGAGSTGIPFTDGITLNQNCGIKNERCVLREPSAQFLYKYIDMYGGVDKFYTKFFFTNVCPIGFIKDNKNYNYYDSPELLKNLKKYIVENIEKQISFGADRECAIVFGIGKNYKIFSAINDEYGFFKKVTPLEHPRYIIQYKSKDINKYLKKYKSIL